MTSDARNALEIESSPSTFELRTVIKGTETETHPQKRTRTFLTDARDDVLSTRGVVPRRRGVESERGVRCRSVRPRAGYRRARGVGDGIVVAVARKVCHGAANDFFSSTTLDDDDGRVGDAGW